MNTILAAIDGRVVLVLLAFALVPLMRAWVRKGDRLDRAMAEHDEQSRRRWDRESSPHTNIFGDQP